MQMRCSLVVRLVAALGVAAAAWTGGAGNTGAAAATAAQDPPAGRSAPGGPTPARPDQDAWRSANRLTDPAARLAALRKILTDFPETALALQIDNAILTVLTTTYPDRVDDIARQMEKVLSHTPASAEPHDRLFAIQGVVTQLADRVSERALLDRAAELHAAAIAALDEARYIAAQRALAAKQGSEARAAASGARRHGRGRAGVQGRRCGESRPDAFRVRPRRNRRDARK